MEEGASIRGGIVLRDPLPWPDALQVVRTAEETGYDAVFVPEAKGTRDAFSALAGFSAAAPRLLLGTGVVAMTTRTPTAMAMGAATVDEMSEGRLILGIGTGAGGGGGSGPEDRPVPALRRYVDAVRDGLAAFPATARARAPVAKGVWQTGRLPDREGGAPPVWIAALGDRMVALAGEVADGVLLNWCVPERVRTARRLALEAAERAGRDPDRFVTAVYVRACLGVEEDAAMSALRDAAGRYAAIAQYARQFELMGLGREAEVAARAFRSGDTEAVPTSLVRRLTVAGSRREALARFEAYRDAGADLVLCYPVPALDPFSSILGTMLAAAPDPAVTA